MHPAAAILARNQLSHLRQHNTMIAGQLQRLNDRLSQLPGLSAQRLRPDCVRAHYGANIVLFDAAKAGMSREACMRALSAEGVSVNASFGNAGIPWVLLHTYPMFSEKKWWRHMPVLPDKVPGCDEANRSIMYLPLFTKEVPELVDQYVKAFEKVWAHRQELG